MPRETAPSKSQCQDGSSSTWSTRWPNRSWVISRGSLRSARRPCACPSAEAATRPASRTRSIAQPAPSRSNASRSAGSSASRSISSNGTDWFSTATDTPSSLIGRDLQVTQREVDDVAPGRRRALAAVDLALGLVDHDRREQLRVLGGREADERRDVLVLGVLAVDRLLGRAGLARELVALDRRARRRAARLQHADQHLAHRRRGRLRDHPLARGLLG